VIIQKEKTIFFQLGYVSPDDSVAVNIWMKNIAKSFTLAGFKPTIQYLCKDTFKPFVEDGVEFISSSVASSVVLHLPKIRAILFPVIRDYYLEKYSKKYSIVAPVGGSYSLASEIGKVRKVHKNGAKYLHPILEHPKVRTGLGDKKIVAYLSTVANSYDYLMPITTYLRDLFTESGRSKPSLLNPIIVDTKAIQISAFPSSQPIKNLVYCGNLGHEEEMHILLDMFALVHQELSDIQLHVLGGYSTKKATREIIQKYKKYCSNSEAFSNITFHGQISHSEVIQQYGMADAFVLPRPFREYSRAGFPTKLGEYLATGKPVITTETGDIPLYLNDLQSAYLVKESTADSFAAKTIQAITHPSAREIGLTGAKVAHEHFSIEASAKRIDSFFGEYYEE